MFRHRLVKIKDSTLYVVFSRFICVLFTSTLRQKLKRVTRNTKRKPVLRRLHVTSLGFCLRVIVNETHTNLEKTTSSVLSVVLINLMCLGFGCWNPEFASMNLPSFRATYLFLCRYSNYSVLIIFLFLFFDNFNFSTMCLLLRN